MSTLQAGAAQAVITPPIGIDLTGFGGRPGPSSTVHDDLFARAVVLASGNARVALVSLDLLGLAPELTGAIRRHVARATGIPTEALLLNCSHTHAGPATITLRGLGERDAAYEDVLARAVAGVVKMACDRMAPARLAFGTGHAQVGINRRQHLSDGRTVLGENPGGPYDPSVPVLRVDHAGPAPNGQRCPRPVALLFSHATHPVILGSENTGISADLPGPAVVAVRRARVGGAREVTSLFLQGCCGDINPVRRGSLEDVRALGTLLGVAAVQGAEEAVPVEGEPLIAVAERLALPLQNPLPLDEARALRDQAAEQLKEAEERFGTGDEYRLRTARAMLAWAEDYLALAGGATVLWAHLELQCIRLGDVALVALGAEPFLEIGQAIAARSPAPHTIVLGYTNGLLGYLPTAAAYPFGGYEVDTAYKYFGTLMVTDASEQIVVEAAARALAKLWSGTSRH